MRLVKNPKPVADGDRRLVEALQEIQCAGKCLIGGLGGADHFHQRHALDRREEMQAENPGGIWHR